MTQPVGKATELRQAGQGHGQHDLAISSPRETVAVGKPAWLPRHLVEKPSKKKKKKKKKRGKSKRKNSLTGQGT